MTGDDLAADVDRIRAEARRTMAAGPVTGVFGAEVERVISVLNDVVATEVVGWLRSTRHAAAARTADPAGRTPSRHARVADLLDTHAEQELRHATAVAERIAQLGARPGFDPATLAQRARTDYSVPDETELRTLLEQDVLAAQIAVSTCQEVADWLGDHDRPTRELLDALLTDERRAAGELSGLLSS